MSEELSRKNRSLIFGLMILLAALVGFVAGYFPVHDRYVSLRTELALCRAENERLQAEREELAGRQEKIAEIISQLADKGKSRKGEVFKKILEVLK